MDTPRTEKGLDTELVLQEQNKETSGPENAEDTSKLQLQFNISQSQEQSIEPVIHDEDVNSLQKREEEVVPPDVKLNNSWGLDDYKGQKALKINNWGEAALTQQTDTIVPFFRSNVAPAWVAGGSRSNISSPSQNALGEGALNNLNPPTYNTFGDGFRKKYDFGGNQGMRNHYNSNSERGFQGLQGGFQDGRGGFRGRGRGGFRGGYNNYRRDETSYGDRNYGDRSKGNNGYWEQGNQYESGNRGASNNFGDSNMHRDNLYLDKNMYNGSSARPNTSHQSPRHQSAATLQMAAQIKKTTLADDDDRLSSNSQVSQISILPETEPKHKSQAKRSKKQKKLQTKAVLPIPPGRMCWPTLQMYFVGREVSVAYRSLAQYRSDILVIPYLTTQLQLYPGNIVNTSSVDYRRKIENKGDKLKEAGSVYLQKCIDIDHFSILAFLKVDPDRQGESLQIGIKNLMNYCKQLYEVQDVIKIESILFPISPELGDPAVYLATTIECIEFCPTLKKFALATIDSDFFRKASTGYHDLIHEFIRRNQVAIN